MGSLRVSAALLAALALGSEAVARNGESHAAQRSKSKAGQKFAWLPPHPASYAPEAGAAWPSAPYYGTYPAAWGNSPGDAGAGLPPGQFQAPKGYIPRVHTRVTYSPVHHRSVYYKPVYAEGDSAPPSVPPAPGPGVVAPTTPPTPAPPAAPGSQPPAAPGSPPPPSAFPVPGAPHLPPTAVHPGAMKPIYAGAGVYQPPDRTLWTSQYYNQGLRVPSANHPSQDALSAGPVQPEFRTSLFADALYDQVAAGGDSSGDSSDNASDST